MTQFVETNTMTDLHGYLKETQAVLQAQGFLDKKNNWIAEGKRLVLLGDYVDRGPESVELYKFFYNLQQQVGPEVLTMLMGNHDIQYYGGPDCGQDYRIIKEIGQLMHEHAKSGLLQVATVIENGDKKWLAVHGGLHPGHNLNHLPVEDIAAHLNSLGQEFAREGSQIPVITNVGFERAPHYAQAIHALIQRVDVKPMTKIALQSMGPGKALKYMEDNGLLTDMQPQSISSAELAAMGIADIPGATWCDVNENLDHETDLVPQVVGHRQQEEIRLRGNGKVWATDTPYGDMQALCFHTDGNITLSPRWRRSMGALDYDVPKLDTMSPTGFSY